MGTITSLHSILKKLSSYQSTKKPFDQPNEIRANIRRKTIHSGAITIGAQVIKVVIQTISMVVLARLFAPRDFGLIAMVSALFGFLQVFQDFGLSTATIQKENISHAQVSALFWINVLLSGVISLICISISPIISWFYLEPKLTWVAITLSLSFLIAGCGTQHRAILMRQMLFGRLALVEMSAMVLGILSAIILHSFEYWALVALSIVTTVSTTLGLWIVCGWRPSLPKRNTGIHSMLNFGFNLTGVSVMNYLSRNLDNVLIGRVWGSTQLGFYSRAYNLFMIPVSQIIWPIASVVTPVLSRLQEDEVCFRKYFLSAVSALTFVTMPIGFFLIIMAEEVIITLYGSRWQSAIPIFRYLSMSMLIQPIYSSTNWLFVATGRGRDFFKYSAIGSFVIILSFFVGLPYGPSKVAMCYSIGVIIWILPNIYFATKTTPVSIQDVMLATIPAFIGAAISGFSIIYIKILFKSLLPIITLSIICLLVMTLVYIICMFCFFGQKELYFSIYNTLINSSKNQIN